MASMLDHLSQQMGDVNLGALSRAVGAGESETRGALTAVLPMLLAGLAKNSARHDGAASLHQALEKDHDGTLLDDVAGFLERGDPTPGDGILRHIFGARRGAVEESISRTSRLDPARAAKLLALAAPMIMAALGRKTRQERLDASGLGRMLAEQNLSAQLAAPQLGGLTRLLDADQDGGITDDLAGMGKSVLGRLMRG